MGNVSENPIGPLIYGSTHVNSRFGMSSLIIKDIKYHILRSLTVVILELLPQTLDSFRVCHIFYSLFPNFLPHFVDMHPHMVTVRNFDSTIF